MRITELTFLAFYINSAIDSGKYQNITFDEIANQIESGKIFDFLQRTLGRDIDLSIFDAIKTQELLEEWQDLLAAVSAPRKFGVENNGLCLLIAYLLEGIQRRKNNT